MKPDYTRQLSSIYLAKRTLPSIIFWTSMFLATLVESILVSNYYGAGGLTIVSVFAPIITIWWVFAAGFSVGDSALLSKLQGNSQRAAAGRLNSVFAEKPPAFGNPAQFGFENRPLRCSGQQPHDDDFLPPWILLEPIGRQLYYTPAQDARQHGVLR